MPDPFHRLARRTSTLGNHHGKYLRIIERDLDGLINRIERRGWSDYIHLWVKPVDYRQEMADITLLGRTPEERLADLGCYFALHFLHFNLNALDSLTIEVTRRQDHLAIYKQFMLRVGHDFRQLISGYMTQLLNLFLPPEEHGEFVFLGVGTRSDQDDIDIGVVDKGPQRRESLNHAIARLNAEMLRKAIAPHYHISEHVCSNASYSASVIEFQQLLDSEIHDFVIINEMLGSARVLGSRQLFSDFHRQIILRYYFDTNARGPQKFHEGYLRGIIGEVRSLIYKEFAADRLNPKDDGLRMIKAGLYAAKTIFGLRQVNAWALLDALQWHDPTHKSHYQKLEICLTYIEVMRFLYHLLISQEEEIQFTEPVHRHNLERVAQCMGYDRVGVVEGIEFFLADYYNKARLAKNTLLQLLPDVTGHLQTITTFGRLAHSLDATTPQEPLAGNLADRFIEETRFFRGARFWDDVIDALGRKDSPVLDHWIRDMLDDPARYNERLLQYLRWGLNSYISFFGFLNLLRRTKTGQRIYHDLLNGFFQQPLGVEEVQRISVVFGRSPQVVYDFISHLDEFHLRRFSNGLEMDLWDPQLRPAHDRLYFLAHLQYGTSRYLLRMLEKTLHSSPSVYNFADDLVKLAVFSQGVLADLELVNGYQERMRKIVAYHDVEFYRVSLLLLNGAPISLIAEEFIHFSNLFIRMLFDTSKRHVDLKYPGMVREATDLALLVTGGYGHMLAFDDDYDIIVLVNTDDPRLQQYYQEILVCMNREIARSGVMPHYRLADHFGNLLCTLPQLHEFLSSDRPEKFIDQSQLLAARFLIGNQELQWRFRREIVEPFIFAEHETYAAAMMGEMKHRHEQEHSHLFNLKEHPGGLRDIEMLLDVLRVRLAVAENSNYQAFRILQRLLPAHAATLNQLEHHYEFLRLMRNLNRLVIAADDHLNPNYLHLILENWPLAEIPEKTPEELLERVRVTLQSSHRAISAILADLYQKGE